MLLAISRTERSGGSVAANRMWCFSVASVVIVSSSVGVLSLKDRNSVRDGVWMVVGVWEKSVVVSSSIAVALLEKPWRASIRIV